MTGAALLGQNLINGVLLGGLYVCIAAGFSLIWGVLNVINLVHGSFIVLGSYLAWYAFGLLGVSPFLAPLLVMPPMFLLGYAMQRGLMSRVIDRPVLFTLTLTFGIDLIVNNLMLTTFSASFRRVVLPPSFQPLFIGSLFIPRDRLYAMLLGVTLTVLLSLLLRGTRTGRAILAVRNDRDAAVLMGVDVGRIYAITFGIGAAFAGAAGALLSAVFPFSADSAGTYLGKAFVVCVLGGLGSMAGVVLGGLALGLIESLGVMLTGPEHPVLIGFLVLLAVLIVRPTGLLGQRGYE